MEVICPECGDNSFGVVVSLQGVAGVTAVEPDGTLIFDGHTEIATDSTEEIVDEQDRKLLQCAACGWRWFQAGLIGEN